jgi:histidine ammonia-lyase
MVGVGDVYYHGVRMPATKALAQAGLKPIQPFAADDNALTSSDAYATGQAALVVNDARHALEWADLIYAMDLNGMNSSITPLSVVVQCDRPSQWLNWDAGRVLDMLKGSYLFDADEARIIQDPESLRASSIRQASAWEEWSALQDAVVFQVNSSDHNPAVHVGLGPKDSWELASAQMMKFYVKGGTLSHDQHGYIVSNANWDPYPMANKLENFVIGLANMDVAIMLRIDRFSSTFFTVVKATAILPAAAGHFTSYLPVALEQEIQSLTNPVAPFGSAIVGRWRTCRGRRSSRFNMRGRRWLPPWTCWGSICSRRACGWMFAGRRRPAVPSGRRRPLHGVPSGRRCRCDRVLTARRQNRRRGPRRRLYTRRNRDSFIRPCCPLQTAPTVRRERVQ